MLVFWCYFTKKSYARQAPYRLAGKDETFMHSSFLLYHEAMLHDRNLHELRSAVLLYHEAMLHDRDLHELRSAVLLYHVQNQHMIQFAVRQSCKHVDSLALITLQLFCHLCQTFFDLRHHLFVSGKFVLLFLHFCFRCFA